MDVICLGELLIDMIGNEQGSLSNVSSFSKYPGGAAANVAVGTSKLDISTSFIGRISKDPFGDFLINTLNKYNVKTKNVVRDSKRKTTIAFIALDEEKKPNYLIYNDFSASNNFSVDDLKISIFEQAKILYFSSISLANSPIREANYEAVRMAHEYDCFIAFDPNIRLSVWPSEECAKSEILKMVSNVEILKLNDDEFRFLFQARPTRTNLKLVFKNFPKLRLIAVTLGKEGCIILNDDNKYVKCKSESRNIIDTTGSGDAFMSAMIAFVIKNNRLISGLDLELLGHYANTAALLTAQHPGAIPALPYHSDIEKYLKN